MIVFHCTKKFLEFQNISTSPFSVVSKAIFGHWYVNLVPTFRGDVFLFVNDPTILSVVLPVNSGSDPESGFCERVLNLYRRLSFSEDVINHEAGEMQSFLYTKTESRSILGLMKDVAWQLQCWAEELVPGFGNTLETFELAMSQSPHKPKQYKSHVYPLDIAHRLIQKKLNGG